MSATVPEEDAVSVESGLDLLAELCQKRLGKKRTFGGDYVAEEEPQKRSEATSAPPQAMPTQSRGGLEQLLQAVDAENDDSDAEQASPVIDAYHRGARSKRARASSAHGFAREASPGPQSSGTMYSSMPDSPRAVSSPELKSTDSPLLQRLRHAAKKRTSLTGAAEAMLLMGIAAAPKASRLRKETHDITTEEGDGSADPDTEYRHVYTRADGKVCANCGVIDTPCWRKFGDLDMCNACAVYAKTHDGKNRPVNLIDRRPAQRAAPKRTPEKGSQASSQSSQPAPVKKLTARAAAMVAKQMAKKAEQQEEEEERLEYELPALPAVSRKPRSASGAAAAAVSAGAITAAADPTADAEAAAEAAAEAERRRAAMAAAIAAVAAEAAAAAGGEHMHEPAPVSTDSFRSSSRLADRPSSTVPPSPVPTAEPGIELPAHAPAEASVPSSGTVTPLMSTSPVPADMMRVLNLQAVGAAASQALPMQLLQQQGQQQLQQLLVHDAAHLSAAQAVPAAAGQRHGNAVFLRLVPASQPAGMPAGTVPGASLAGPASSIAAQLPTTTPTGGMLPLGPLRFAQMPGQTILLNGRTVLLTAPHIQLLAPGAVQAAAPSAPALAAGPALAPGMPTIPMLAGSAAAAGAPGIMPLQAAGAAAFATS